MSAARHLGLNGFRVIELLLCLALLRTENARLTKELNKPDIGDSII